MSTSKFFYADEVTVSSKESGSPRIEWLRERHFVRFRSSADRKLWVSMGTTVARGNVRANAPEITALLKGKVTWEDVDGVLYARTQEPK